MCVLASELVRMSGSMTMQMKRVCSCMCVSVSVCMCMFVLDGVGCEREFAQHECVSEGFEVFVWRGGGSFHTC